MAASDHSETTGRYTKWSNVACDRLKNKLRENVNKLRVSLFPMIINIES